MNRFRSAVPGIFFAATLASNAQDNKPPLLWRPTSASQLIAGEYLVMEI